MSTGTETRERIVKAAAGVFNTRGYAGASVSDLEQATGLRTGGIYRHFASKEALALEALDYAIRCVDQHLDAAVATAGDAVERIEALVRAYRDIGVNSVEGAIGGCPVVNAAIEHDDAGVPALRARAERAIEQWRSRIERIAERGIAAGEIRAEVNPRELANTVLALAEGAMMISNLTRDSGPMDAAVAHVALHLDAHVRVR